MDFNARKKLRSDYYFKFKYKNKMVRCVACSGTGYYDALDKDGYPIKCGACGGEGKLLER